jgi:hypothetical protein
MPRDARATVKPVRPALALNLAGAGAWPLGKLIARQHGTEGRGTLGRCSNFDRELEPRLVAATSRYAHSTRK